MLISDVLHKKGHEVIRIRAHEGVADAVRKLSDRRIGALVVEDDWMKVVGIFSERDLLNGISRHGPVVLDWKVEQLMTAPVLSCHASDRVDGALALMTQRRIRHLPVIDNGKLHGMISIGDLVKHRLDEKELEANVLLEISRMRGQAA